jgi:hypothetical protein
VRDGQGFRAEIRIGNDVHWVLLATHTAVGPRAFIYDAKFATKIAGPEWAENMDDAKARAEVLARKSYAAVGRKEPFPDLEWQPTG